jgi:hypothetical protein
LTHCSFARTEHSAERTAECRGRLDAAAVATRQDQPDELGAA